LALVTAGFLVAQEKAAPGAGPGRSADEAAVRKAAQDFARAFEKGDAKAIGAFFTEGGEYVDEGGEAVRGRAALEKAYADFFAKRQELKAEAKTDSVRFLGKDTAVEIGRFTVKAKSGPPVSSKYNALHVRQDGRWLMAHLQEEGDDRPDLQSLAWLIGTWESTGDEVTASTTYEWTDNQKFIRGRYTITPKKGGTASSGTQVLGVDPAVGVIRAWTFDSDGGIGEAAWTWDGERWAIHSEGTLADGSPTTAVNYLAPGGNDGFTWRSTERTLDGQRLPDVGPVKVRRVK
jgi:uncharacterized protein (TIGR02246 family)